MKPMWNENCATCLKWHSYWKASFRPTSKNATKLPDKANVESTLFLRADPYVSLLTCCCLSAGRHCSHWAGQSPGPGCIGASPGPTAGHRLLTALDAGSWQSVVGQLALLTTTHQRRQQQYFLPLHFIRSVGNLTDKISFSWICTRQGRPISSNEIACHNDFFSITMTSYLDFLT